MKKLDVYIQVNGEFVYAGDIVGKDYSDATFGYGDDYLASALRPISISLPLQKERFSKEQTYRYFEGLLPEGFARRSVAKWIETDELDYLTILEKLGSECLGGIRIGDAKQEDSYELLSPSRIKDLASEGASESTKLLLETHLSLTGASGKVGLYYYEQSDKWYLPHGLNASTHILKQSHIRYKKMVVNELLCMRVAREMGIDVAESSIMNLGSGRDEDVLYVTRRFDRVMPGDSSHGMVSPYRLHQEDFGQALGIDAINKYEKVKQGYVGRMFDLVRNYSSKPVEDVLKLWDMIVFNYLIGNTDSHIKNYSLLYSAGLDQIRLAPAYDIISTKVYDGMENMAYYIGDERSIHNIGAEQFKMAADEARISQSVAMERYNYIARNIGEVISKVSAEMASEGFEDAVWVGEKIVAI